MYVCSFTTRDFYASTTIGGWTFLRLSPSFVNTVQDANLLSSVVSRTVELKQCRGEWTGLCPFHFEQTASFIVNDEKGFYHCFGCGAHGEAVRFLMDARGLTFTAAVKKLAAMAGIPLPRDGSQPQSATIRLETSMPSTKGGAKLSRSETVTVRLDPQLNYLCELAARAQRRTKSSFIEWAIADSLKRVSLPEVPENQREFDGEDPTIQQRKAQLWQVDEPDRLVALALIAPALLTHEEQLIWKILRENGYFWKGRFDKQNRWSWEVDDASLIRDRLRRHWATIQGAALGDLPMDQLPTWQKERNTQPSAFDTDFDDDVPF